jgi:hypothetical protein
MRRLRSGVRLEPRVVARIRIAVGIWLLILAAIWCGAGGWWGALLVAPAALHFYLAYRVLHRPQA